MCRDFDLDSYLKGQGHTSHLKVRVHMLRQAVFPIFPFLTSGSVQFVEYVLYVHSSLGLCCLETQQTNQQVFLCKVDKLSQASVYVCDNDKCLVNECL